MKKIFEIVLCLVFIGALILAGSQNEDGSCNIIVAISCLGIITLCAVLWDKFFSDKVQIPDNLYDELRKQIEEWANEAEDGKYEDSFEVSNKDITILVKTELYKKRSKCKFRDEAWGHVKTFTEYNTYYLVTVTDYVVKDRFGRMTDSDFNPELVEMEVDGCNWA